MSNNENLCDYFPSKVYLVPDILSNLPILRKTKKSDLQLLKNFESSHILRRQQFDEISKLRQVHRQEIIIRIGN